jgi:aryl-alcohol dehydrogenase-like predicted oxidoreductase
LSQKAGAPLAGIALRGHLPSHEEIRPDIRGDVPGSGLSEVAAVSPSLTMSRRMEHTDLGRTGDVISAIGYGAMGLSVAGRPDQRTAARVIEEVLDLGISFIDSADVYGLNDEDLGHNERLLAAVLAGRPDRHAIRIASKVGLKRSGNGWIRDASPLHIRAACERSLKALNADRIYLYQLHAVDPAIPLRSSLEALAALRAEGKCAHVGLSNVTAEQIVEAMSIVPIATVQNRLSPFYRESVTGQVVETCRRLGITFLAYRPFGGPRLSRRVSEFQSIRLLAQGRNATAHQITLAWLRGLSPNIVPLVGTIRIEHVGECAAAVANNLTAADMASVAADPWIRNVRFCSP